MRTVTSGVAELAASGTESIVFAETPTVTPSFGVWPLHETTASVLAGDAAPGASTATAATATARTDMRRTMRIQEVI